MLHQAPWQKRLENLAENHGHCQFLGALLAPLVEAVIPATVGATVLGAAVPEVIGGALGSAAIGAGISGLTGGNPLLGAVGGGLSGALGAFGPALGAATGIGMVGGDILTGVAGGVLSSEITGTSPLTGALMGGATGALSGVLGPSATAAGATSTATTAPGGGAAATAVPSSGGTSSTAAALGDTASLGTGGLYNTPTAAGTSISGTPSGGTGGGGGAVSGVSAPMTPGTVSGAATTAATPTTTGGGLYGSNWATPAQVSEGWGSVSAAGGSPLATGSTGSGILDSLKGDISKLISSPTALLAGGLLGYEMLSGGMSNNTAADTALQQQAASAASTATMLQAPLRSGVLPPGAQASLDLSRQNQEATTRSVYASMGMGESTGQADALQAISERIAADKFGIENMLFTEAAPYAQLASSDDIAILNQQRAEDQQFTSALTNFVAALAGSKSGTAVPA